jgi:hypothetical protein
MAVHCGFSITMLDSQKETIFNSSSLRCPRKHIAVALILPGLATPCADFATKKGPIHAAGRRAQREIQGHGGATDGPCAMAMQSILALQKRLRCIKWP